MLYKDPVWTLASSQPSARRRSILLNAWPGSSGNDSGLCGVQRPQWQTGPYIRGKYHQRELHPILPGAYSMGSSGTCLRDNDNRAGAADVVWLSYTSCRKYWSLKNNRPQASHIDQDPYMTQNAQSIRGYQYLYDWSAEGRQDIYQF